MEDVRRTMLAEGERCWRLKEFGRESLAKADEAVVGDCETAFSVRRALRGPYSPFLLK
jgi:hypothetical protein